MAIFRPGPLVGAISGTLHGAVFRQTRYGPVIARRPGKTIKHTLTMLDNRVRLRTAQLAWINFTQEERLTWNAAAKLIPFRNRLGIPHVLTGQQLFLRINLTYVSETIPYFTTPPIPSATPPPYNLTFNVTLPNHYMVDFDCDLPIDSFITRVFATRPMTKRKMTHYSYWRLIFVTDIASPPYNLKTAWQYSLGLLVPDETAAIKVQIWKLTLLPSPYVSADATVV